MTTQTNKKPVSATKSDATVATETNPGGYVDGTVENATQELIGNNNGNDASKHVEATKSPTAADTIAEKRNRLKQQLLELEQQENNATVIDIVMKILNTVDSEELESAIDLLITSENATPKLDMHVMLDVGTREFRYADTNKTGTAVVVSAPSGNDKRSWFESVTNAEGVTFPAPMKSDTSNDVPALSEIVGINLVKDRNNNSTSTIGKQNLMKSVGWVGKIVDNR